MNQRFSFTHLLDHIHAKAYDTTECWLALVDIVGFMWIDPRESRYKRKVVSVGAGGPYHSGNAGLHWTSEDGSSHSILITELLTSQQLQRMPLLTSPGYLWIDSLTRVPRPYVPKPFTCEAFKAIHLGFQSWYQWKAELYVVLVRVVTHRYILRLRIQTCVPVAKNWKWVASVSDLGLNLIHLDIIDNFSS